MRIDQVLPDFARHDAIGNHVLEVRRVLRRAGFESDIWAAVIDPRLGGEARHYRDDPGAAPGEGILLYHDSTFSEMAAWLAARAEAGETLVSYYHNITPAPYFARWEPVIAAGLERARVELRNLAPHVALALAASSYNRAELDEAGYATTAVAPLLVDLDAYHAPPDARTLARLRRRRGRGGREWLFVGRVAPNKCQHDVLAAFAVYRQLADPAAHLTLVGGASSPRYLRALHQLAGRLELGDSVDIVSGLGLPELVAHFRAADVFVCLSEHEGFCVPVLEAMELGTPVVAYAAAAVPETAGTGALLLDDKDPLAVAAAVDGLLRDDTRRAALAAAGHRRAAELALPATSAAFLDTLTGWLRSTGAAPPPAERTGEPSTR